MRGSLVFLAIVVFFGASAQNLVSYYKIKTRGKPYGMSVSPSADGNMFVYGQFDYLNGEQITSIAKVDQSGKRITTFHVAILDQGIIDQARELPGGKILVRGGFNMIDGVARKNFARLNADGTVDETFNHEFPSVTMFDLQSDGRIIIQGTLNGVKGYNGMARLGENGITDESFDKTVPVYSIPRLAIGQDDKIYYADLDKVYRRLANGAPDPSFSTGLGTEGTGQIWMLHRSSTNKVFVAGYFTKFNGVNVKSLAQLNANGSVDTDFNTKMGGGPEGQVLSMDLRANGNVLMCGQFTIFNGQSASAVELQPDGTPQKIIAAVSINWASCIRELKDGKITLGGEFTTVNSITRPYVALFNQGYTQVATFNPDLSYTNTNSRFQFLSDGNQLYLGGGYDYDGFYAGGKPLNERLARFDQFGQYDPTFDTNLFANSGLYDAAIQSDGKIVVVGSWLTDSGQTIQRLTSNGTVDPTFPTGSGPTINGTTVIANAIR